MSDNFFTSVPLANELMLEHITLVTIMRTNKGEIPPEMIAKNEMPQKLALFVFLPGQGKLDVNYKMGDTVLRTTVKEKDLGVTICAGMKMSEQCGIAASMGNQMFWLIRRNITYKDKKKLIILMCKAIVLPHLK